MEPAYVLLPSQTPYPEPQRNPINLHPLSHQTTKRVGVAVKLQTCSRNKPASNFGRVISYPEVFRGLPQAPPGEFQDSPSI